MSVTVNTNVSAMTAQRHLGSATNNVSSSMERLSSGLRINSAADDAAGLQISNRLTSQTNGLNVAMRNANDGISIAQTAEGAMQESTNIMQRMRDLSLQSANGSNSSDDRAALQKEVSALQDELDRISDTTTFGGQNLLDGSYGTQEFQVGSNANETISVTLSDISSAALGASIAEGTTEGTIFGGDAGAVGTAGVITTAETLTINAGGQDTDVEIAVDSKATEAAKAINNAKSGVTADTLVEAEIDNVTDFAGTIEIGSTSVEILSSDNEQAIADKLSNAGIDAVNNSGTISLSASGVDGIEITQTSGSLELANAPGGTAGTAYTIDDTNSDGFASAALTFSSNTDFSVSGGTEATGDVTATAEFNRVSEVDISDAAGAQSAIDVLDGAIAQIDEQRADLGAVQNRFNHTLNNLANINENVNASNSRIKDVDFATETTDLTKNQILQQASTSILAQAKMNPQAALSLL
ncbi:flagellin [Photobacterium sp. ZSDE20]|uniref:Flagellin n=1 Tax=Photobacterium pectinilyticum TaxID=2906793 RepID=A0ABT1N0V4_9GAMM|nr:flagellin [Photobacterium sp. ZSDE20]MCQ1058294.1 flagellin [Photobacterium sp. ZSDE20]MDD1823089.1 flagellin [Photobacterium sp. ZSDE20]